MNYQKPKISSKKIKLNFFLTNITPLDRFTIVGDVYAGSGDCSCGGNCGCGGNNCAGDCGCGGCKAKSTDCSITLNSSCNSACASNSGKITIMVGNFEVTQDRSCSSNSNCQGSVGGCACNSAGGACNSGSGGGSGNSGSGSCNSGG